jgi:pSer/pThr/pTyr-binding forkhead associated (FHA) protein
MAGEPRPRTAGELRAVLHAERQGVPFFVYRDPEGKQQIVSFGPEHSRLTIGRNPTAELRIAWDNQVSALHAMIEQIAGELTVVDDGLSRNGSYLNGERLRGRRRLRDGDMLRLGRTVMLVRNPADAERHSTVGAPQPVLLSHVTEQQRRVLITLCRALTATPGLATLPTNQEIANELHISESTVKLHLRALFDKFQIADLPQNKKRLALAQQAVQSGLLTEQDLRQPASH